jgi:hypothetical protein
MADVLENHERAHHAAGEGAKTAALLVAGLAAILAVCEQQAKHAEIKVQANGILAADAWSQYQAKSTRQLMSRDLADVLTTLDPPTDPALADRRSALGKRFLLDAEKFQKDPSDGKDAIAERAHHFEELREESLERSHTYDNAAACLELGIVLSTASAITASTLLIRFAMLMGAAGIVLGVLGATFPSLGAF